jgi:hypothetical protein
MQKTFRKTMKKQRTSGGFDATYNGIRMWYKSMFEQLGWMILAKSNGYRDKIISYKMSLQRLKTSIQKKHSTIKDADKKEDLSIMLKNTILLIDHVEKDFA